MTEPVLRDIELRVHAQRDAPGLYMRRRCQRDGLHSQRDAPNEHTCEGEISKGRSVLRAGLGEREVMSTEVKRERRRGKGEGRGRG